ncbi:hypothetical protein JXB01_03080 [Candidatus Micrarchaeota archaeon]|nr:hypothetical protein [Candidatus Micrarchaeota archaeon]
MIEDEIIHWWKDEKGEQHRTILRIESEKPTESNGFPRDGIVVVRLINTIGSVAIKLNPDEALRLSTQTLAVAKELLNQKRDLWNRRED